MASDGNVPCDQNCTNTPGSFECSCNDGYEIAEDGNTCTDIEAPYFTDCPSSTSTETDDGSNTAIITWIPPIPEDNSGQLFSVESNYSPGHAFPLGSSTVLYIATDHSGNMGECSFDVIVADTEPPVFENCPASKQINTDIGQPTGFATWIEPTILDNSGDVPIIATNISPGLSLPIGINPVQYTATDGSGNVVTCYFDITISDNEAPNITGCPGEINTVTSPANAAVAVSWDEPIASDNSGLDVRITSSHTPGDLFHIGITKVIYIFTDMFKNNAACHFMVTVQDKHAPIIEDCPDGITVPTEAGKSYATVTWAGPTAVDNSGHTVQMTTNYSPGEMLMIGEYEVLYSAWDPYNNTAYCAFKVIVSDDENPIINCLPDISQITDPSLPTAVVIWTNPSATDNSFHTVEVTCDVESGSAFVIGTTEVTCIARDGANNEGICKFNISILDTEMPVIHNCNDNLTEILRPEESTAVVSWTEPNATDNFGGRLAASVNQRPPATLSIGIHTISYTFTDNSGNTAQCVFTVEVEAVTTCDIQQPKVARYLVCLIRKRKQTLVAVCFEQLLMEKVLETTKNSASSTSL
ncbi:hyalin-like [Glandiceps talaboti]